MRAIWEKAVAETAPAATSKRFMVRLGKRRWVNLEAVMCGPYKNERQDSTRGGRGAWWVPSDLDLRTRADGVRQKYTRSGSRIFPSFACNEGTSSKRIIR